MARRRSKRLRSPRGRNIVNPIARRSLPLRTYKVRSTNQLILDNARIYGHDNRAYNPLPKFIRPARQVSGRISLTGVKKNVSLSKIRQHFLVPERTIICVRRQVRKEVIHALKKSGRNGQTRSRRNQWSNVRC